MEHDCGTTSEDPYGDPRFNAVFRGWSRLSPAVEQELVILMATPGIPLEWIYAVFKLDSRQRRKLWPLPELFDAAKIDAAAKANALTVGAEDGLRMLRLASPYQGPAPHWSRLALQMTPGSSVKVGTALGAKAESVRRWRRETVFDPMTLVRVKGGISRDIFGGPTPLMERISSDHVTRP